MTVKKTRSVAVAGLTLACLLTSAAGAAASDDVTTQTPPAGARAAEGTFVAVVDFGSLQTRDVRGNKCEFTVEGVLTFSGTIEGVAAGTTTAVIFAPCPDALASPPGTYFDVFRFTGDFSGEVLGEPADGTLSYAGQTRVGGGIDATIILDGEQAMAVARADAVVAQGGSYSGTAKLS